MGGEALLWPPSPRIPQAALIATEGYLKSESGNNPSPQVYSRERPGSSDPEQGPVQLKFQLVGAVLIQISEITSLFPEAMLTGGILGTGS